MTLGSLFSGSGGFELAGTLAGIKPLWNAEIEPFPSRVTAARFPDIPNLGDVSKINGGEIPPVDIITFGSPCQDLSVAGKQKGIHDGERSNLFFHAIRIIREMLEATNDEYPKYAVWENVPGAFSSNKGDDFRDVLQSFVDLRDPLSDVPKPKKWGGSGCIVGDGYSVAWRVYDAQYWGVPQRRKRIYLIADFRDERAGEILFKPESLSGDPRESRKAWEGPSGDAEGSIGRNDQAKCLNPVWPINTMIALRGGKLGKGTGFGVGEPGDPQYTISTAHEHAVCYALDSLSSNSMKSGNPHSGFHKETMAKTIDTNPNLACNQGGDVVVQRKKDPVITINEREMSMMVAENVASTLTATDYKGTQVLCYDEQKKPNGHAHTIDCRNSRLNDEKSGTLQAKENGGYSLNYTNPVLVLNDQGGQVMDVSDRAGCLRAQEHGHQPVVCFQQNQRDEVRSLGEKSGALTAQPGMKCQNYLCYEDGPKKPSVCFEPGIMRRDCKTGSHVSEGVAATLRANMGDNQLAVAYPIENHPADSRVTLQAPDEPCQTLTSRMGTGGGQCANGADEYEGGCR